MTPTPMSIPMTDKLREAATNLLPYLDWQMREGGSHHPTLPSATGALRAALAAAPQPDDEWPVIPDTPEERAYRKGRNEGMTAGHKLVPVDDPSAPQPAMNDRSFPDAADGRPLPPMADELMAAGLNHEDARFVARMLRDQGYYLIRADDIGWPEIGKFNAVLHGGQAVTEDAGGFFARAIMALFRARPEPVVTYQQAARALLSEVEEKR